MNDLQETLTHKVGPLPTWAWGAVGLGAIAIVLYVRRNHAAATGTQQQGVGFGDSTGAAGGGGGGGVVTDPVTTPIGTGLVLPTLTQPLQPLIAGPGNAVTTPSSSDTIDPSWQPNAVMPVTSAEESAIEAGRATPAIAVKEYANSLASTVNFVADQVGATNKVIAANVGAAGATEAQNESQRQAVATELVNRGYTAASYGGRVYAAQNPTDYFNGLPAQARQNLAQLLVNMGLAPGTKS